MTQVFFEGVLESDNRKIRLYLRYPIEPGPKHKMVLWNFGKSPKLLDVMGNVKQQDAEWDVSIPGEFFRDGFVALAYDGARIGSWWPARPDWSAISSSDGALQAAAPTEVDTRSHSVTGMVGQHPIIRTTVSG